MTAVPHVVLSLTELRVCAEALGAEDLPVVLGRGPDPDDDGYTVANRDEADARESLRRRAILTAERGCDEFAAPIDDWVHTLVAGGEELAARRISGAGVARLCIARHYGRGRTVVASRPVGGDAPVTVASAGPRARELLRFLGDTAPAQEVTTRAPLDALTAHLAGSDGFAACAAAFTAVGAELPVADALAAVLTTTTSWTEVVRVVRRRGVPWHTPAAMVVYDSAHGRLVAVPDRAPDGTIWVTFGPGDRGRIGRGIDALDGLSADAWTGDT